MGVWVTLVLLVALFASCATTRNIPEGEYLLDRSTVQVKQGTVSPSELKHYLKQQPNIRILGLKFHLRMYNIPRRKENNNAIGRWFKRVGEAPVVLDPQLISDGTHNITKYLSSKGYYNATVYDSIVYSGKRASVFYKVSTKEVYKIGSIGYSIEDTLIKGLVSENARGGLVEVGNNFDFDVLKAERERVERFLRNSGYYNFSKDFVRFTADTSIGGNKVALTMIIKNPMVVNEKGERAMSLFKRYRIRNVHIYPNYDPIGHITNKQLQLDTINVEGINYIFVGEPGIDLDVLVRSNHILPKMMYSNDLVSKTKNSFATLKMYKYVNIVFDEVEAEAQKETLWLADGADGKGRDFEYLDCSIQLSQHTLQSYQIDAVGTNTSGSIGAEGSFSYQHKNLLKGAEVFDFKFRGMFETNASGGSKQFDWTSGKWTREVGGSVALNLPKYVGFGATKEFITRNNIGTQISASYSYQNRPQFKRNMATMLYGYNWKSSRYISHIINPIEINAINISDMDSAFNAEIQESILRYSYIDQIVTVSSYGFTFNNQNIKRGDDYVFFRFNVDFSGNLLNLAYSVFNVPKDPADNTYKMFNTSFSQFVRTDVNFTYHQVANRSNAFAYRVFIGVGVPYGNSKALPFEKRYYSGGANGIRAWQARDLGPGSAYQNDRYPNQTADVKLEFNVEYRFRIVEKVEGALFVDAGNIWSLPSSNTPENETFRFGKFYEQIAVGSGMGVRLNLGFFTLRADFGYKVFDPAVNPEQPYRPWVPFQQKFSWSQHMNFNFGIGYPF